MGNNNTKDDFISPIFLPLAPPNSTQNQPLYEINIKQEINARKQEHLNIEQVVIDIKQKHLDIKQEQKNIKKD
ncbi:hypothetical protein DICPUDRAFT_157549 [Dictyostelium purpureum]|uniref:Uncharacterized protein n=1 Tax=Dictyostelium purpureum TaxID=5786 RepID=F0ZZE5_DICPU|nr:uncharacterized protein DICPUDRAFT_157549 [Dictyostelium purpureum]EGC30684.1 hypothetical protein DICPUDRAFT_157549 [Dictyostelium purpureum]|eukprot:XP_003292782.1 hypothetical protein DICPUDRAFT_157549 [Dictyostelium purpureum]